MSGIIEATNLKVDSLQGKTTAGSVAMPAGATLQVVQGILKTQVTNSSNGYSLQHSQAITPKFSSSKVLVMITGAATGDQNNGYYFKIYKDGSEITDATGTGGTYVNEAQGVTNNSSGDFDMKPFHIQYLDSPNTTSQVTYQLYGSAKNGTAKLGGRADNADIAIPTCITLMEIAG